ncbi:MAG: hypothetical protein ACMVO5_10210 [Polymorphobacter sp.]|uniref:hypothetical protein n=1 Tax=Polymorphobacter sp. TaxID=1909290 RepID=UPI003A8C4613
MKPAAPIIALKAWALAEVVMAAVYAGAWRALRFGEMAARQAALIGALEMAYLLVFLLAALLGLRWWLGARQPRSAGLGWAVLVYSLASIASFAAWERAETLAEVRALHALDAGVSLLGLWPALAMVALIRETEARRGAERF